jgi:hypothetical protein
MASKKNTPAAIAEAKLAESLQQERWTNELLRESIADLQLALEDQGWQRTMMDGAREFDAAGRRKIAELSRVMFLKNPLINRAVTLQAMYVWAQGVSITSDDEATQEFLDAFFEDPKNQAEFGHQARTLKEQDLQVFGNLFFVLFTDQVGGMTRVRTIPVDEIAEIVCNPDDAKEPWLYKRCWAQPVLDEGSGTLTSAPRTAWYPALGYEPDERRDAIAGAPVMWESPVYHVKVGSLSDMKFGVPETYQAIDWARAYKTFLENWFSIVKAYARFAWHASGQGGQQLVDRLKTRLNASTGDGYDANPPATTAATFVGSGVKLDPIKTAGATTSAEDGRRGLLMVCAGMGMPETFFGDVSTGNLATAKSLDRPTELKFRDRQELWKSILITILEYAIARNQRAANGRLRIAGGETKPEIRVTFPPILEHDIRETIGAIVEGTTLGGKTPAVATWQTTARLVLEALGVADVKAELAALEDEWDDEDSNTNVQTPQVAEALRELRTAITRLHEARIAA